MVIHFPMFPPSKERGGLNFEKKVKFCCCVEQKVGGIAFKNNNLVEPSIHHLNLNFPLNSEGNGHSKFNSWGY